MYAFVDNLEKPFKMRYNAFSDEMEFDNEGVLYDLDKTQYKMVNFDDLNKKYAIVNYQDGNQKRFGYLVELVSGSKSSLLKSEGIEFYEGKKSTTGFGVETLPEYKQKKEKFYMKMENGSVSEIPSSKGKFSELFGENASKVEEFIKKNKISLSTEKDLKTLFQFINKM